MGIGRGDSSRRVVGLKPVKVAEFERRLRMMKDLMNGRPVEWNEKELELEWAQGAAGDPDVRRRLRAEGARRRGPRRRRRDHPARRPADHPVDHGHGARRPRRRRAATRTRSQCIVCAPSHISDDLADAREQVRWFPAMVSNHVMDLIERYGYDSRDPGRAHRLRQGAEVLRLQGPQPRRRHARRVRHRRDLRPLLRARHAPSRRPRSCEELESVGVDQFNIYLMTQGQERDARGLRRGDHPAVRRRRRLAASLAIRACRETARSLDICRASDGSEGARACRSVSPPGTLSAPAGEASPGPCFRPQTQDRLAVARDQLACTGARALATGRSGSARHLR